MKLNLLYGFIFREWLIEKSYKLNFLLKFCSLIFPLLIFYFLCNFISKEYFQYIFFGIFYSRILYYTCTALNDIIRQEQYWGTIERLLLLPYNELTIFIYLTTPKFLFLFIELGLYIFLGSMLGISFTLYKIVFIFFYTILLILIFFPVGIIFISFVLLVRRGEPAGWLITSLIDLLSGVYFPTEVLPEKLQKIANLLPTTYTLKFFRSVLSGEPELQNIIPGILFGVIFFPISIFLFNFVLKLSLKKGSLGIY